MMKVNLDEEKVPDEVLVARFQRDSDGEEGRQAAGLLFERYHERVYLWCYRRVRDHDVACDLAQDALLSAYRALGRFQGRARYSSWLFTIARNRCFRALRRPGITWDESVEPDDLPQQASGPEFALIEQEEEDALLELVNRCLEPNERLAVWLRVFELLPLTEITRRLGIETASGARGLLQTARRKLRAARESGGREGGESR